MIALNRRWLRLGGALGLASLMSLVLFVAGALRGITISYSYMIWNLFLAWLPLLFIGWLIHMLQHKRWSSWQGIALSLLWLGFLPNSFYLVSDFIHLQDAVGTEVIYDAVMFTAFTLNGLLLGYTSLYLFQNELRKRLPASTVRNIIGLILLLCSFAVYLGRDLRWNTWDVLLNPAGILFDVSDRLISPLSYPRMFVITGAFFALLATMYYVILKIVQAFRENIPR